MAKPTKKKAPTKKPVKKVVAKPKKQDSPRGFMWKLLERKEAEQKRLAEEKSKSAFKMYAENQADSHGKEKGFSRFAGPRRRAA